MHALNFTGTRDYHSTTLGYGVCAALMLAVGCSDSGSAPALGNGGAAAQAGSPTVQSAGAGTAGVGSGGQAAGMSGLSGGGQNGGGLSSAGAGGAAGDTANGGTANGGMGVAGSAPVVIPIPAEALRWTGNGSDERFDNPQNWQGNVAPSAEHDVLFADTPTAPTKNCSIDSKFVVKSLTVTKAFSGQLHVRSPGVVAGNLVLAGSVSMDYDPHEHFSVQGPWADFREVTSFTSRFARGNISLTGSGVHTVLPPADKAVELPELQAYGGATLKLGGSLKSIGLYVESDGSVDFSGQDLTVKLLGVAGPVLNIGGSSVAVTGAVSYTTNALGASYHSGTIKSVMDLAPKQPWRLLVQQRAQLYGETARTFTIDHANVGNLDVTGSDPIEVIHSTDAGNNVGLSFK